VGGFRLFGCFQAVLEIGEGKSRWRSVVISGLEKVDAFRSDAVNESMLLGDASRPALGKRVSERFGFTESLEGVAQNGFNQVQHSDSGIAVGPDPIPKILSELGLENSEPFNFLWHRGFRAAIRP
jgi:hypothetical protein